MKKNRFLSYIFIALKTSNSVKKEMNIWKSCSYLNLYCIHNYYIRNIFPYAKD